MLIISTSKTGFCGLSNPTSVVILHLKIFNLCSRNHNLFFLIYKVGADAGVLLMFLMCMTWEKCVFFFVVKSSWKVAKGARDKHVFIGRPLISTQMSSRGYWVKVIKFWGILEQNQVWANFQKLAPLQRSY